MTHFFSLIGCGRGGDDVIVRFDIEDPNAVEAILREEMVEGKGLNEFQSDLGSYDNVSIIKP